MLTFDNAATSVELSPVVAVMRAFVLRCPLMSGLRARLVFCRLIPIAVMSPVSCDGDHLCSHSAALATLAMATQAAIPIKPALVDHHVCCQPCLLV